MMMQARGGSRRLVLDADAGGFAVDDALGIRKRTQDLGHLTGFLSRNPFWGLEQSRSGVVVLGSFRPLLSLLLL